MAIAKNDPALAKALYRKSKSAFMRRGVTFAIMSGICYGLYSSFLSVGEYWGVWSGWWGLPIAATAIGYALMCAVGAGLNDLLSGFWCLIIAGFKGKAGDYFRSLKTKPGWVMMCCGVVGGPIATTAYCVGLMTAGGITAAISALCAAIGAILGRILFKQHLNLRMIVGIIICFGAAVVIGGTAFLEEGTSFVGCLVALIAAVGWGFEGCIAGYGTSLLDYEIGITLRQTTSGVVNLLILIPILCVIAKGSDLTGIEGSTYGFFVGGAICTVGLLWFVISGFFANPAYSFWYKGNSMCGAALGMTCNALYSFWVPFFLWLVFMLVEAIFPEQAAAYGIAPAGLTPIQWVMALVEVFGIWMIAMNPLDVFKKKED